MYRDIVSRENLRRSDNNKSPRDVTFRIELASRQKSEKPLAFLSGYPITCDGFLVSGNTLDLRRALGGLSLSYFYTSYFFIRGFVIITVVGMQLLEKYRGASSIYSHIDWSLRETEAGNYSRATSVALEFLKIFFFAITNGSLEFGTIHIVPFIFSAKRYIQMGWLECFLTALQIYDKNWKLGKLSIFIHNFFICSFLSGLKKFGRAISYLTMAQIGL